MYRVPVGAGVRAIDAWAEYPWPESAQALVLRDRLGWTSSPTDERCSLPTVVSVRRMPGHRRGRQGYQNRLQLPHGFDVPYSKDMTNEAVPITERADAYVEALTAVYGQGKRSKRKQHHGDLGSAQRRIGGTSAPSAGSSVSMSIPGTQ